MATSDYSMILVAIAAMTMASILTWNSNEKSAALHAMVVPNGQNVLSKPKYSFAKALRADFQSFEKSLGTRTLDKCWKVLGVGGWTITYALVAMVQISLQACLINRFVLAYNVIWELGRTVVWNDTDTTWYNAFIGIGWFGLDLIIVYAFLMYGDGTSGVSLQTQRLEFGATCAMFMFFSCIAASAGPCASRLWRHASCPGAFFFQMCLIREEFALRAVSSTIPLFQWIMWSAVLGNIGTLMGVQLNYSKWYHPMTHPLRFLWVTVFFLPLVAYGVPSLMVAVDPSMLNFKNFPMVFI